MPDARIEEALGLMTAFAQRTGPDPARAPRRYLWTDAFAVCNYLGLARATGRPEHGELALRLVDDVHHVLGRHREDDPRSGWISGLDEAEGERHPTRGGLRIGKPLPERGPNEPYDERREWDRDGQYFHYLAQWMHALDQVARSRRDPRYNSWGRELAATAHAAFTYRPAPHLEPRRMYWKMSIDLGRAQVASMGQHDPLSGYVNNLQLQATATALAAAATGPDLSEETRRYAAMLRHAELSSADPLGLGGLLVDAWRMQQLLQQGTLSGAWLPEHLLQAALPGLEYYARSGELEQPARQRLAFRELGLAIGLHALERMHRATLRGQPPAPTPGLRALLEELLPYLPLRGQIESFWRDPRNRDTQTWMEHRDINEVMLATSLVPGGYLDLLPLEGTD